MRGRLIFPLFAEVYRLDRAAMALWGTLDPDFQEPRIWDAPDADVPQHLRLEQPLLRVPCQVESQQVERLQMTPAGNAPRSQVALIMHLRDLDALGLVDEATGNPLLAPGDRVGAIVDRHHKPQWTFANPPGVFVVETRPIGFGLSRHHPQRNLLQVILEAPDWTIRRPA
jgi:hypothetical protein